MMGAGMQKGRAEGRPGGGPALRRAARRPANQGAGRGFEAGRGGAEVSVCGWVVQLVGTAPLQDLLISVERFCKRCLTVKAVALAADVSPGRAPLCAAVVTST